MTEIATCACGLPGTVDPNDGDMIPRCAPDRRAFRRLQVQDRGRAPWVEPEHPEPGHQSGDPLRRSSKQRLMNQIEATRAIVLDALRLAPGGLDALDALLADGFSSSTAAAGPAPARAPKVYEGTCGQTTGPGVRCGHERPCPEHDSPVTLTSVEAAVVAGGGVMSASHQLETAIMAMAANAVVVKRLLAKLANQANPPAPVAKCNRGVGREGVIEWGDPLCERHHDPTRAGMCTECWQREAVWREAHDLPERERTKPPTVKPVEMCVRDCGRPVTPGRLDGLCNADRLRESRRAKETNR